MAMSTADSYINASSILFTKDICKSLKIKISKLFILRFFGYSISIIAVLLALWSASINVLHKGLEKVVDKLLLILI